ncbi:MAG: hypothetical protein ACKOEY_11345, partial [Phenylobacterium sp.]
GLPGGQRVRASVEAGVVDPQEDTEKRRLLSLKPGEALACRRDSLVWREFVLSRAVNWYRPGRLTAEMRRRLAETDEPFGVVARPLDYRRVRLETRRVEAAGRSPVLHCRAVLETPDGEPLALVEETYPGD